MEMFHFYSQFFSDPVLLSAPSFIFSTIIESETIVTHYFSTITIINFLCGDNRIARITITSIYWDSIWIINIIVYFLKLIQ